VSKATKRHCAGTVQSQGEGYEMLKRWVLSRDRKTATEGAEVTSSGRLFQTRAAATGKAFVGCTGCVRSSVHHLTAILP